jgi:transposase
MVCPKEELVMPGAYSADLRERVLLACERGRLSRVKLAALFQIGESTVCRWLQAWRAEARRAAKPHAGGPAPRLDAAALGELWALVAEANDLSLAEYAAKLAARTGVTASGPTICRGLQKLELPRKKGLAGARAGSRRHRRRTGGLAGGAGRDRSAALGVPG